MSWNAIQVAPKDWLICRHLQREWLHIWHNTVVCQWKGVCISILAMHVTCMPMDVWTPSRKVIKSKQPIRSLMKSGLGATLEEKGIHSPSRNRVVASNTPVPVCLP